MPKMKQKTTTASSDTNGMATTVYADAVAVGEDTLTLVNASVQTKDHPGKSVSKGKVTVQAAAESPDGGAVYADATADLAFSDADRVIIKTKNKSGGDGDSSYDITVMKFKVIDFKNKSGETTIIQKTKDEQKDGDDPFDLDGNVAVVTFDAQASGDDTLATVDVYALALEDELSQSTITITSAVD